jgi:phosphoglycerate dehydrogenase-like enzyme
MALMLRKVLATSEGFSKADLTRLSKHADVIESWRMDQQSVEGILPEVEAVILLAWPSFMSRENMSKMRRLRFIQTVMVGVNHVPFHDLPKGVVVCSNAGAYSVEVGEHAWGLLLAAAKKIIQTHDAIKEGGRSIASFRGQVKDVLVLEGKTMGIVGFGGIGREVSKYAKAFGMSVLAINRSRKTAPGVRFLYGERGLEHLLSVSDAVLLSAPLTKTTERLIGEKELGMMKKDAILVNVARGDIVDQGALYAHMVADPSFRYATDVWWFREGRETLETEKPLATLPNFVGTPHTSGPTGLAGGRPFTMAVDNTIRYLRGVKPKNVVDVSDYRRS